MMREGTIRNMEVEADHIAEISNEIIKLHIMR